MTQNACINRKNAGGSPLALTEEMNGYLAWLKAGKYSPATVRMRSWQLCQLPSFLAAAGVGHVREITPALLKGRFKEHLIAEGLSSSSIQHTVQGVKQFFAYLEAEGLLFENPARDLAVPKRPRVSRRSLTPEQIRKLISQPNDRTMRGLRDRAFLELLACTALPMGKMLSLTVFDVDTDSATVCIKTGKRQKGVLSLNKQTVRYLTAYLKTSRPHLLRNTLGPDIDGLWVSRRGRALSGCQALRIVRVNAESANLPDYVNTDFFRRSCVRHMLKAGSYPLAICMQLGYSSISTFARFLGVRASDLTRLYRQTHGKRLLDELRSE